MMDLSIEWIGGGPYVGAWVRIWDWQHGPREMSNTPHHHARDKAAKTHHATHPPQNPANAPRVAMSTSPRRLEMGHRSLGACHWSIGGVLGLGFWMIKIDSNRLDLGHDDLMNLTSGTHVSDQVASRGGTRHVHQQAKKGKKGKEQASSVFFALLGFTTVDFVIHSFICLIDWLIHWMLSIASLRLNSPTPDHRVMRR